jgi:hypothetical protein
VGTSISNRSPETPRWRAVQAAYVRGLPLERVAREVLRAAEEWKSALTSDAIATYVDAVGEAYAGFEQRLRGGESPAVAIQRVIDETRRTALATHADVSAVAVAERAFQRTLLRTARGPEPLIDTSPSEAAAAWAANRGHSHADLVGRFVSDLATQFAEHVIARDTSALVGHERLPTTGAARELGDRVSAEIGAAAHRVFVSSTSHPASRWREAVGELFATRPGGGEPSPADHD